ncbi:MAG TPA: hypothetical protein VF440_10310 [Novosphingobium sp.]
MGHALLRRETDNVERLHAAFSASPVSDELDRIMTLLRGLCPPDTTIGFEFAGRLQVNIDVRKREDVLLIKALLPTIESGLFRNLALGNTPNRAFFHRITAEVAR